MKLQLEEHYAEQGWMLMNVRDNKYYNKREKIKFQTGKRERGLIMNANNLQ